MNDIIIEYYFFITILYLHTLRYKNTFTLLHLLEQYEMARTGNIVKEYTWPESFPDCTPALRMYITIKIMYLY